jgi:2-polyprenyl-6-methoxyphenol hydroxylase-like FAD-dependent oxidoreductase
MARTERILIVGGGIGGLTLATALRRHGFTPELIEHSPVWRTVGAGMAMQPNGIRVLRSLGLGAAVERAGTVIRHWDYCDQRGSVLAETDLEALWGDVGPFIGIARAELQRVSVAASADVPTRLGTWIKSLGVDDDAVSVQLNDGSTETYDLVVGADGIGSTVRTLAVDPTPPVYGGQMVWRSLAPIRPRGLRKLQFLLGDGCFFGLCPVGDGQTYGFGSVAGPRIIDPVEGRLSRLRERFARFGDSVQQYLGALERDDQVHCSPIRWVAEERWHKGRVVLIGDAAHASLPMMGQGGSLAVEDAYVLAESLRSADTVHRALADYAERRRRRVRWVRQQSQIAGDSLRLPVPIRNAAFRACGREMMQQRFRPLANVP